MDRLGPEELTPWELRNGIWYKREDYHCNRYGINGSKFRACRHLMTRAILDGYDHVVTAQAMASPQAPICATLAEELGMRCTVVVGASNPESARRNLNIALALRAGAELDTDCRVAYNGTLQPYARKLAERLGAWQLPYAISLAEDAPSADLEAFSGVGGAQARNLPPSVETLVIPFGSGNTAAGVLYGLSRSEDVSLRRVVLAGIGPDRFKWLDRRLRALGATEVLNDLEIERFNLHPWFADYAARMPETVDGIVMHPVYEGKIIRWAKLVEPEWWTRRDDTVGFWVVAGPM